MSVTILAIESSCDDTAASVLRDGFLLSSAIANQDVHRAYGGVVPELASRAHQQNIIPVVDEAIKKAGIGKEEYNFGFCQNKIKYTENYFYICSIIYPLRFCDEKSKIKYSWFVVQSDTNRRLCAGSV